MSCSQNRLTFARLRPYIEPVPACRRARGRRRHTTQDSRVAKRAPAVFENLKARLDRLFAESSGDARVRAAGLREALIEARVAVTTMREAIATTERELAEEQRALEAAERRGRLAAQIPDPETVGIAERFAQRHRERVTVLARRLEVQRDELGLAERDVDEMGREFRAARQGLGPHAASVDAAWRDLAAAGGSTRDAGLEEELLRRDADRMASEAAVDAQLAALKRKFGKQ